MKILYIVTANIIFLAHLILVLLVLFGFLFDSIYILYLAALILTLLTGIFLKYCPLTKLEFYFRKKLNPSLNYNSAFIAYYGRKFFEKKISNKFIRYAALIFLSSAIILNVFIRAG